MVKFPQTTRNPISNDWEEQHEYVDGQIFTIAGASENQVDITTNLTVVLANKLSGDNCQVLPSDSRFGNAIGSVISLKKLQI